MSQPTTPSSDQEQNLLDSVRSILRGEDADRLDNIEQELSAIEQAHLAQQENLLRQIADLEQRLAGEHVGLESQVSTLQQEVESLEKRVVPAVTKSFSGIVRQAITQSQDTVAAAHAPIIGPAIRQQIRDSRDDMVEALYPIIFEAVSRAISEFRREIQRNIDARYESTFGAGSVFRGLYARSRGISSADLAIRDALSFEMEQIFIIERESGLLVSHYSADDSEGEDSDLIGGMLTAIGDFVSDSFSEEGQHEELNEIQYGDNSVIIQSGHLVYAAAVIDGNEPAGFRGELRNLVSKLHINHESALRDYEGDPSTVEHLKDDLVLFSKDIVAEKDPQANSLSQGQRRAIFFIFFGLLLASSCACFQLWIDAQYLGLAPNLNGERPAFMVTIDDDSRILERIYNRLVITTELPAAGIPLTETNMSVTAIQLINSAGVHLFPQPSDQNNPLLTLPPQTVVQLIEIDDEWIRLATQAENGDLITGWAMLYWFSRDSSVEVQN